MNDLNELLTKLARSEASDLHLCAGAPPCLRLFGDITPVAEDAEALKAQELEQTLFRFLTEAQQSRLMDDRELDFSIGLPEVGRFRTNIHRQRNSWAAVFRKIPLEIPSTQELGLPEAARTLALKTNGLVLVTGPTGSGKSMTLAAMIEIINKERACHVITVEDPIEFLFKNRKAIIKQREIGSDTDTYASALKHIFRQDPDVIMIGELRDRETIAMAITAASTGRLVLGTLHTMDAPSTIERLIESFPPDQQSLVRNQVAGIIEGTIAQQLVLRIDSQSRALATEVMVTTPSIRNQIRSGKSHQIASDIETGKRFGMHSMNQSLEQLVLGETVKLEEAIRHTRSPEQLLQKLGVPQ
jgi:twitching motility protein PilT